MIDSPANAQNCRATPSESLLCRLALVALSLTSALWSEISFAQDAQAPPNVSDERELDVGYNALWIRGEYRAALDALNAEIAASAPIISPQLRYDRAQLLFATGFVDEAIVDIEWLAERQPQPSYSLETALMYQYRGMPLPYEKWLSRAAQQTSNRYYYRRRTENIAAIGRIAELVGTNPKTILSAHFTQVFEHYQDLGAAAYVAAGDLAYRNSGFDIAEDYYLQALEREPENQDALAGLLECYWRSHDERAEATLAQLEGINPNHPRLDAVKVERLLENLNLEDARGIIEKQLRINAVSHRFRSLKAAALFLENDLEGMNDVIEAVLDYNPVRSEVYRTVGRFASRHYRFKQGVEFQEKALESDAKDYEARALYTLDLMRLGREQEGKAELEKAFEADPYNVSLYNLLQLMDTLETFETIERGPFILKLPKREAPVMAEAALELLEDEIALLGKKYRVELETPILIEMFDNHDDFMVRSVGLPGNAGHLGICFGQLVTMDAPSVRPTGSSNWRSVLWHEFAHVISLQKTKNRMPRWLSEGISVYEEQQYSPAFRNRLDPDYRAILAEEGIPGLRNIDGFFTAPKSAMHLMYGYFTAGEFVSFYTAQYGFDALVNALERIAEGAWAEDALVSAAQTNFEILDAAFHAHLEKRFAVFDHLPKIQTADAATAPGIAQRLLGSGQRAEPPSSPFTDALTEGADAAQKGDWVNAEAAWLKAYDLFPDYSGGDAPLRQLARLYESQGREKEWLATLERIRTMSPQELEATLTLARHFQAAADWDNAIQAADWALGIDPYDASTHKLYAEALTETGRGEEAIDTLGVLTHLDPGNASTYRLQRADLLLDSGQADPAKREVIALLEQMPHYWDAQKLLLDIIDRPPNSPAEPQDVPAADASGAPQR